MRVQVLIEAQKRKVMVGLSGGQTLIFMKLRFNDLFDQSPSIVLGARLQTNFSLLFSTLLQLHVVKAWVIDKAQGYINNLQNQQ